MPLPFRLLQGTADHAVKYIVPFANNQGSEITRPTPSKEFQPVSTSVIRGPEGEMLEDLAENDHSYPHHPRHRRHLSIYSLQAPPESGGEKPDPTQPAAHRRRRRGRANGVPSAFCRHAGT